MVLDIKIMAIRSRRRNVLALCDSLGLNEQSGIIGCFHCAAPLSAPIILYLFALVFHAVDPFGFCRLLEMAPLYHNLPPLFPRKAACCRKMAAKWGDGLCGRRRASGGAEAMACTGKDGSLYERQL